MQKIFFDLKIGTSTFKHSQPRRPKVFTIKAFLKALKFKASTAWPIWAEFPSLLCVIKRPIPPLRAAFGNFSTDIKQREVKTKQKENRKPFKRRFYLFPILSFSLCNFHVGLVQNKRRIKNGGSSSLKLLKLFFLLNFFLFCCPS